MWKHLLTLACAALLSAPASAYTITLNAEGPADLSAAASDPSESGQASDDLYPTSLPYSNTTSSVHGEAASVSEYNLSNAGFAVTFDHSRSGGESSFAWSTGEIHFSVDEDIVYVAAGR